MKESEKQEILARAEVYFETVIMPNHISNLKKLKKLSKFSYNPFLLKYLSYFLSGRQDSESLARVLIYPRILGTSINTSFGQNIQRFCSDVLKGFGSTTNGIDIEFIDHLDGRRKYCQIKAGPQTINKDDIETISRHFIAIKNLARTNNLNLGLNDLIVGVLYGTPDELSGNYKGVQKEYNIFVGKDFWYRLTGDENFYEDLINTFGKLAIKAKGKDLMEDVIRDLAKDLEENFIKQI